MNPDVTKLKAAIEASRGELHDPQYSYQARLINLREALAVLVSALEVIKKEFPESKRHYPNVD